MHPVVLAQFCLFGWYVIPAGHFPQKGLSKNLKIGFPLSPPPNHALLPLTHDLTVSCIGWIQAGELWALRVPLFHVCPKSACCLCVCRGWPAQSAVRSWPFSGFLFLYGLPYLGLGLAWWWALLFLQPTLFPATISYHSTLSFLLRSCFASIWLGLFGPAVHSSPNGPARLLVLLLHCWRAPVSHLFSVGRPGSVYFPWASSALFLTLHYHGFLLNSLSFLDPITLFLILGVHGLAIDPLLSLLSLLWACHGPFSFFHIIYCPWFAFSLFLSSFKPIYFLKAHLFIS